MEAQAFIEEMSGVRHFKGYRILVITYIVGSFIFQLTCPRWSKANSSAPARPVLGNPRRCSVRSDLARSELRLLAPAGAY